MRVNVPFVALAMGATSPLLGGGLANASPVPPKPYDVSPAASPNPDTGSSFASPNPDNGNSFTPTSDDRPDDDTPFGMHDRRALLGGLGIVGTGGDNKHTVTVGNTHGTNAKTANANLNVCTLVGGLCSSDTTSNQVQVKPKKVTNPKPSSNHHKHKVNVDGSSKNGVNTQVTHNDIKANFQAHGSPKGFGGKAKGGLGGHAEGGKVDCSTNGLVALNALNLGKVCKGGKGGSANGGSATGGHGGPTVRTRDELHPGGYIAKPTPADDDSDDSALRKPKHDGGFLLNLLKRRDDLESYGSDVGKGFDDDSATRKSNYGDHGVVLTLTQRKRAGSFNSNLSKEDAGTGHDHGLVQNDHAGGKNEDVGGEVESPSSSRRSSISSDRHKHHHHQENDDHFDNTDFGDAVSAHGAHVIRPVEHLSTFKHIPAGNDGKHSVSHETRGDFAGDLIGQFANVIDATRELKRGQVPHAPANAADLNNEVEGKDDSSGGEVGSPSSSRRSSVSSGHHTHHHHHEDDDHSDISDFGDAVAAHGAKFAGHVARPNEHLAAFKSIFDSKNFKDFGQSRDPKEKKYNRDTSARPAHHYPVEAGSSKDTNHLEHSINVKPARAQDIKKGGGVGLHGVGAVGYHMQGGSKKQGGDKTQGASKDFHGGHHGKNQGHREASDDE